MIKNYNDNYLFLCGIVNAIGASAFVINPLYSLFFSVLTIFIAYKLPDIFLDPITLEDFVLYLVCTLIFCYMFIALSHRFSRLEALMFCLPLLVGKEIWFYFKRYD
jgi:hypothetical protein